MQHPGPCVLGYVCAVRTVCLLYGSRYMCHGDEMCSCTPGTVTTMGGKVQLRSCGVSCRDPQSTVTGTVYSKNFIRFIPIECGRHPHASALERRDSAETTATRTHSTTTFRKFLRPRTSVVAPQCSQHRRETPLALTLG
jgi:hypothetical protein